MDKLAILCVDDEQAILKSLKKTLKRILSEEYLIETLDCAQEALYSMDELLQDGYQIPIIISDYIMPNMKGDELLRRVHAIYPKTLKIMLTGQASIEAMANTINYANLYRYIAKPLDLQDFNLTIKEALNSYFQARKLEHFYADLEDKIAKRTLELHDKNQQLIQLNYELHDKNKQLIQLNQDKNEFLGIAAHDLKNPLAAIQGLASMIQNSLHELPQEKVIEMMGMISTGSQHMFDLIQNLLNVNTIESGKMNVSLEMVDIQPILRSLVVQYSTRAKAKAITLHTSEVVKKTPFFPAFVDRETVQQILDNLISNAVKYSPLGKPVHIKIIQTKNRVRCEIKDEGPGLSEQDKQRLFSKFTRLTPQPTGNEHSTGLGLFIVKKLVDAMKGSVWCESELGKGTTFIVEFPMKIEP